MCQISGVPTFIVLARLLRICFRVFIYRFIFKHRRVNKIAPARVIIYTYFICPRPRPIP